MDGGDRGWSRIPSPLDWNVKIDTVYKDLCNWVWKRGKCYQTQKELKCHSLFCVWGATTSVCSFQENLGRITRTMYCRLGLLFSDCFSFFPSKGNPYMTSGENISNSPWSLWPLNITLNGTAYSICFPSFIYSLYLLRSHRLLGRW